MQEHTDAANRLFNMQCVMQGRLTNRYDDQNQRGDQENNNDQVAVAQVTGDKVSLRLRGPGGQLSNFLVAQTRYGFLHLLRVHVSGLQSLLGSGGREELPYRLDILLPGPANGPGPFL